MVTKVSADHLAQPSALFRDGTVRRPSSAFTSLSLARNRLRIACLSNVNIPLLLFFPPDVRESEEVEGHGLSLTTLPPVFDRKRAELQEAGLVGVQFQSELPESFDQSFQNRHRRCWNPSTRRLAEGNPTPPLSQKRT